MGSRATATRMRPLLPTIPFVGYGKTKLVVNAAAARDAGLKTPADILAKADEVVGK